METDKPVTELRPILWPSDKALFQHWVSLPHVRTWWGDCSDRLKQFVKTPAGNHAMILGNGRSIGYVRWETVASEDLKAAGLNDIPEGSIDVDIFIGDPNFIGCGIGPTVLEMLVAHFQKATKAPLVGLCSSVKNKRAHKAFRKSGFRQSAEFHDPAFGHCYVFTRQLR